MNKKKFKYRFSSGLFTRKSVCLDERREALDKEDKPSPRAKRLLNLPNSWDTRLIRFPKSWKDRWKIRKQYEIPEEDFESLSRNGNRKKIKIWIVNKYLADGKWRPHLDTFYDEIDELIKEGKIEAEYETKVVCSYEFGTDWSLDLTDKNSDVDAFIDASRKVSKTYLEIKRIRLKQ